MQDFLGDLLHRIEETGSSFSAQAYTVVGDELMPLLRLMVMAYVAWYGLQLIMGTSRLSVGEVLGRIIRMIVILALAGSWENFNTFFYHWLSNTPEDAGRAILAASGTGITEPTNGLSQIWKTANEAASVFAEQSGYFAVLPSMIGGLIMAGAGIFIAIALAILILAKVMLWVLIGTAPIFIACMLFDRTRAYGMGWFNQVLTYALIPLFIYVIAAFLIAAMDPELTKIDAASNSRTLTLPDVAGFLLLCLAGGFVMLYIQSIGQGIAGGIAFGVGNAAFRTSRFLGLQLPFAATRASIRGAKTPFPVGKSLSNRFTSKGDRPDASAARDAMQKKISGHGLPGR